MICKLQEGKGVQKRDRKECKKRRTKQRYYRFNSGAVVRRIRTMKPVREHDIRIICRQKLLRWSIMWPERNQREEKRM